MNLEEESSERADDGHTEELPPTRVEALAVIRAVALHEFFEHGFHGTTLRKIAKLAELSTAGVYHYFNTKEEILFDSISNSLRIMVDSSEAALVAADGDPLEELRGLVRAHVAYHVDHKVEAFVGLSELRGLRGERLAHARKLRRHQQHLFDEAVQKLGAAGYPVVCPEETSRAIVSMGMSVSRWYQPGGPVTRDEILTRYVTLADALVGARP